MSNMVPATSRILILNVDTTANSRKLSICHSAKCIPKMLLHRNKILGETNIQMYNPKVDIMINLRKILKVFIGVFL